MVADDQQLVHTSFVPSSSLSPRALLVWNQGLTTLLGEFSVFIILVKALDIRFPSQFPKHNTRGARRQ
ncbi:unnamed protein product [Schistosoma margrebowiei]|uniref:Uncharacterized protein n=1 Tax=Schistosoma margrebowiei TaxID=48269 RepID=A0A183LFX8_9TREM|nr:unnamed protein product [Schistosoma margrebowiei]